MRESQHIASSKDGSYHHARCQLFARLWLDHEDQRPGNNQPYQQGHIIGAALVGKRRQEHKRHDNQQHNHLLAIAMMEEKENQQQHHSNKEERLFMRHDLIVPSCASMKEDEKDKNALRSFDACSDNEHPEYGAHLTLLRDEVISDQVGDKKIPEGPNLQ